MYLGKLLGPRAPKGGGGGGDRGSGGSSTGGSSTGGSSTGGSSTGGSSSTTGSGNTGGSHRPSTIYTDNRTGIRQGHRVTNTGTTPAWYLALPVWARVLATIGILWAIFFLGVLVWSIFKEVGRRKEEGGRFNIFNVLRTTILTAFGIKLVMSLAEKRPPGNKEGDMSYEEVDNAERGLQEDGESPRKSFGQGSRTPPSPNLAPSPLQSPALKQEGEVR